MRKRKVWIVRGREQIWKRGLPTGGRVGCGEEGTGWKQRGAKGGKLDYMGLGRGSENPRMETVRIQGWRR